MPSLPFRCPRCRAAAVVDLRDPCPGCGAQLPRSDGVLDFVVDPERRREQAFYDQEYADETVEAGPDLQALGPRWSGELQILSRLVRRHVGDLRDKRVVLLGNGSSEDELHFLLDRPAALVVSDLSPAAVRRLRERYAARLGGRPVSFAAIDAYDLPFGDGTVDVLYGNAFVHHLPALDPFFAEVARVLAPGGRAVFMDDAYAPVWQRSKETWLRPLMSYTHRRNPISPEDMRFTMAGGFREDDLARRIRAVGGEPYFVRQSFLYYFWTRAADRLFPARLQRFREQPRIARTLIDLDERLSRYEAVRKNLIRLVWGFRIPAAGPG